MLLQARKALSALKGLVKLQALVRGHLVRKQATATLRCMQALVTVQARALAQRIRMAEDAKPTNHRNSTHRKSTQDNRFRHNYHVSFIFFFSSSIFLFQDLIYYQGKFLASSQSNLEREHSTCSPTNIIKKFPQCLKFHLFGRNENILVCVLFFFFLVKIRKMILSLLFFTSLTT